MKKHIKNFREFLKNSYVYLSTKILEFEAYFYKKLGFRYERKYEDRLHHATKFDLARMLLKGFFFGISYGIQDAYNEYKFRKEDIEAYEKLTTIKFD